MNRKGWLFDLWCLTQWSTIFQLYRRDRFYWSSTPEKPPICHKSLTNFITYCCIEYTSPWKGFELTTLAVIGTDCTGNCTSNYYAITTTMAPEQTSNDNNGIILFCNYFVLIDVDGVKEFNTLIRLVDRESIGRWQTCQFNRT
jgi:hypothetical protein